MSEVDYALAYTFRFPTDPTATPYRLVFRVDAGEAFGMAWDTNPRGQIVAVVVHPDHQDRGQERYLSRPGIAFLDAERALDAAHGWPFLSDRVVDLAAVKARIVDAGLV